MRLEHAVLLAVRQTCVEWQNLGMAQIALAERIGGIANFALTAHENENITRAFAPQFIHRIENSLQLIALGVVCVFNNRAIAHFNRISPA
ncbi:hypothetical protein D3C80_774440 [compost metagenome]